jgi:hypothetical protein
MTQIKRVYEVRPRKDHRGVDVIIPLSKCRIIRHNQSNRRPGEPNKAVWEIQTVNETAN